MSEGKAESIHHMLGEDWSGWGWVEMKDQVALCAGFFFPPLSSVFNATVASFPNGTALQSLRFHVPLQVHSLSSLSSLSRITVKSVLLPFSADANPFFFFWELF